MAILTADNFKYQGRKPLDNRLVQKTVADMTAMAESIIYNGIIVYVEDEKKFYTFDVNNTVDPILKKWRELTTGGSGGASIEEYINDTNYKKDTLVYLDDKIARVTADYTSANLGSIKDCWSDDVYNGKIIPISGLNIKEWEEDTTYEESDIIIGPAGELGIVLNGPIIVPDNLSHSQLIAEWRPHVINHEIILIGENEIVLFYRGSRYYNNQIVRDQLTDNLYLALQDFEADGTITNYNDNLQDCIDKGYLKLISSDEIKKRIKTSNFLSINVGSTSQIPVSTLSETDITKLKENQIVFDSNGAIGYIASIDTTNSQIGVTTMTVVGGSLLVRILSNEELNKTILGNTTLEFTDIVTSLTVNELVENLLVYDADGTVAKIDSISTNTTSGITTIITTTLTTSADDSFDMKYYRYNNALDKTVDTTHNILFSDLNTTATTTINDLQIEQIVFDGDGTVSKIENIDTVNNEITVRIISSGITNTPIKEYKTTETLSQVIDSQQVINVPAGLNVNDIEIDQLVYDQEGTVARIVGIDTTANTLTVQIMTGLGMPVAPDHKKPTIKNGGSGYAVNDIIETTTPNVFVKVTAVDTNGIITDVLYDNTATSASPTSGTKAIIDYDQVIYGGYGKNWYELQGASVLVAQTVAEGFTYIQGYDYSIDNAGTGYAIDDIIATNVTDQYVRVTDVDVNGEILSVEYTRDTTVNTSGSGATITAASSTNVFIIPDDRWNTGTALFTITNDDGASVQFLRTDPITTKYNAGASGKIYKFVYNPINGTITQSFAQVSGGSATEVPGVTFEENHAYKKGDLIVRNNKMYVCNGDYTSTNDFDTDLANGDWQLYEVMEIGGEIV